MPDQETVDTTPDAPSEVMNLSNYGDTIDKPAEPAPSEEPADAPEKAAKEEPEDTTSEAPEKVAESPDTPDESDVEQKEETEEEEQPKKQTRRDKRIGQLVREGHEARGEVRILKEQLEAARAKPTEEPEQEASKDKPPVVDDFETYELYQDARDEYRDNKLRAEFEQRLAGRDAATQRKTSWDDKSKTARVAHADFDEVMETATVPKSPDVVAGISQHEQGAEIAYHLGQHPELVERLDGLTPLAALIEIGNIAASLNPTEKPPSAPEKTEPIVSKASKPIEPIAARNPGTAAHKTSKNESVNLEAIGRHIANTEKPRRR